MTRWTFISPRSMLFEAIFAFGSIILLITLAALFGCSSANANYAGYAESVVAQQSLDSTANLPPIVIPDSSSLTPSSDAELFAALKAYDGARLPGPMPASDYVLTTPIVNLSLPKPPAFEYVFSSKEDSPAAAAVELANQRNVELPPLPSAPSTAVVYTQCGPGMACSPRVNRGPTYVTYPGGGGYNGFLANRPVLWRITHPFGGKGIPLVRRFTRR